MVVAEGTSDELKAGIGGDVITFAFENNDDLENAKNILNNTVQEKKQLIQQCNNIHASLSSINAVQPSKPPIVMSRLEQLEQTHPRLVGLVDIISRTLSRLGI